MRLVKHFQMQILECNLTISLIPAGRGVKPHQIQQVRTEFPPTKDTVPKKK